MEEYICEGCGNYDAAETCSCMEDIMKDLDKKGGNINGIITEHCKGCDFSITKYCVRVCARYASPKSFVRSSGLFMCPSQGIYDNDTDKTRRIRVGQQKQRRG